MKSALPWATPCGCFPALEVLGPAWLISSFKISENSLLVYWKNVLGDIKDNKEDQEKQEWMWEVGWKGEADESPCLHHDPNLLVGASETWAKTLRSSAECDHKSGDKRVVIIPADEWRMPWARLPRAQVLSTDTPKVAGLAPLAASSFTGRAGGHCGATVCRSPGAAVSACSLWRSPLGSSSSPSVGPSSAFPTLLKAAAGIPSPSPAAERG